MTKNDSISRCDAWNNCTSTGLSNFRSEGREGKYLGSNKYLELNHTSAFAQTLCFHFNAYSFNMNCKLESTCSDTYTKHSFLK